MADDAGEWDTNCKGVFFNERSALKIAKTQTKGYFDLMLNQNQTVKKSIGEIAGDCTSKNLIKRRVVNLLKFNGSEYKQLKKTVQPDWMKFLPKYD